MFWKNGTVCNWKQKKPVKIKSTVLFAVKRQLGCGWSAASDSWERSLSNCHTRSPSLADNSHFTTAISHRC